MLVVCKGLQVILIRQLLEPLNSIFSQHPDLVPSV